MNKQKEHPVWIYFNEDFTYFVGMKYDTWAKYEDSTPCIVVTFNSKEDREFMLDFIQKCNGVHDKELGIPFKPLKQYYEAENKAK